MARKKKDTKKRHRELLTEEKPLWKEGLVVAGLDEAGAGPLAGPVTAGCVVLNPEALDGLVGVDDSKKLTAKRRADMAEAIKAHASAWAVAHATVKEIDRINILQAGLLAMRRALAKVMKEQDEIHHLLVDARVVPKVEIDQTNLEKGDARSLSIAAASILAKVARDRYMTRAAAEYPDYGFDKHKGYGTKQHLEALKTHGVTPLHRRTFEPIQTMLCQPSLFD